MFKTTYRTAVRSWKTTLAAIGTLLTIWPPAISLLFDGDAATNPEWNVLMATTLAAIGLIFAKDGDKSTEQMNAA